MERDFPSTHDRDTIMCMKKPGPRCYNSVIKKVQTAKTAVDNAQNEAQKAHANARLNVLIAEADSTKVGLEKLEHRFAESRQKLLTDPGEKQAHDKLEERLNNATYKYGKALSAYDATYGTVNGKAPAKNWTEKESRRLENVLVYDQTDYDALASDSQSDSISAEEKAKMERQMEKLQKKIDSTRDRMHHVLETRKSVTSGLIADPTSVEDYDKQIHRIIQDHKRESRKSVPDRYQQIALMSSLAEAEARREVVANGSVQKLPVLVDSKGKMKFRFNLAQELEEKNYSSAGDGTQKSYTADDGSTITLREAIVPVAVYVKPNGRPQVIPAFARIEADPNSVKFTD